MAHPPGHPLAALLGKACTLLPLGSVALKVGLASSLCGAAAAAQTAALGRLVAQRVRRSLSASPAGATADATAGATVDALLGAAAGLSFGLCYAAAFQAVRPEVYALSALLVVSLVLELARFDASGDRRRLTLAALWAGLALSNHHLLALAVLAPSLLFAVARRPRAPLAGLIARVSVAGALGLGLFAYLPLRAQRHPLVDWGAPFTWARLYWTVSAQAFQKAVALGSTRDVPAVAVKLAEQLHPVGALLALAGIYLLVRRAGLRRLGLLLVGGALADAAVPAMLGFDPANPDHHGYLEVAVALLAVSACALPAALSVRLRLPARGQVAAAAVVCALAAGFGVTFFPRVTLAADDDADRVIGAWYRAAPARALAVTSYYQTVFGVWYLRSVEGARPDVELVHRHFLAYPGYRDELVRARPALAPLLLEKDVMPSLPEPLLLEYDVDLPAPLVSRSSVLEAARGISDEQQTRRFVAWQAFLAAHRACRLGDAAERTRRLAEARRLFGASPELDALGNCDLPVPPVTITR